MQLGSVSAYRPAYQPYALAMGRIAVAPSAWSSDTPELKEPPPSGPVPGSSIFDKGTIRLALLTTGTAAVGGTAGYFVSKAAGWSLKGGAIGGAVLGAVIPMALIIYALKKFQ